MDGVGALRGSFAWCHWKVFFLLGVFFREHLSSLLDCPPTCTCSPVEIYCNKSDTSRFFLLLSFSSSSSGAGNNSAGIEEVLQNITSM